MARDGREATSMEVLPCVKTKQGGMFLKVTVWEPLDVALRKHVTPAGIDFTALPTKERGRGDKAMEFALRGVAAFLGAPGAGAAMKDNRVLTAALSNQYVEALDGGGFRLAAADITSAEVRNTVRAHRVHVGVRGAGDETFVFTAGRQDRETCARIQHLIAPLVA